MYFFVLHTSMDFNGLDLRIKELQPSTTFFIDVHTTEDNKFIEICKLIKHTFDNDDSNLLYVLCAARRVGCTFYYVQNKNGINIGFAYKGYLEIIRL